MIKNIIAAIFSLLIPGTGHLIKVHIGKGMLIMIFYMVVLSALISNPIGWMATVFVIPLFHIGAAITAYLA